MYLVILLSFLLPALGYAEMAKESLEIYIQHLEQRISYLEEENTKISNALEEMGNKLEQLLSDTKNPSTPAQTSSTISTTLQQSPDSIEMQEYNSCIELISAGKFAEAKEKFGQFAARNPNSSLLPDAYYWMGEIYFAEENYKEAAVLYLNSYKQNPYSHKSIESIFKLALTLKNTANPIGACHTLKSILTEFGPIPISIKDRVQKELESLKQLEICE